MTALTLCGSDTRGRYLRSLRHCTRLQSLCLTLETQEHLLQGAAAWSQLPLTELHISASTVDSDDWQQIMQHVAAVTGLKQLSIRVPDIQREDIREELAVCKYLDHLQELESLALQVDVPNAFKEQDAEHLSALVNLTDLELCYNNRGPYLDTTIVCLLRLAVTLTGLKVLSINEFDEPHYAYRYIDASILPAIGRLKQPQSLRLEPLDHGVATRGLQLLTSLTRLSEIGGLDAAGGYVLEEFIDRLAEQRQEPNFVLSCY